MSKEQSTMSAQKNVRSSLAPYWNAVHVLLYFKRKGGGQRTFLVWENIYLVKAANAGAACKRAEALGRAECRGGSDVRVNGRPARLAYGGIRKVIRCAPDPMAPGRSGKPEVERMHDGVEATFSQYLVRGTDRLKALIGGARTAVSYEE